MARSLDIPETQVVVDFAADPHFRSHHRALPARVSAGVWACLGPDMEVEVHDLNNLTHEVVGRNVLFPAHLGVVHHFDPIHARVLAQRKRTARQMAVVLGTGDQEDVSASNWRFSDPWQTSLVTCSC